MLKPFYNDNLYLNSQAHILIEIEDLVRHVINHFEPIRLSPLTSSNRVRFESSWYVHILRSMPRLLSVYRSDHDYAELITAFWHGCKASGFLSVHSVDDEYYPPDHHHGYTMDHALTLARAIKHHLDDQAFRRKPSDRLYQMKSNHASLRASVASSLQQYSCALVIRGDLGYCKEYYSEITIQDVYQHLDRLNKTISYRRGTFEHLIDYHWTLEQGVDRGYHIHMAFLFKGYRHQQDWGLMQAIGELWREITGGYGSYFNGNHPDLKEKWAGLDRLGIGKIKRNDTAACENTLAALSYLAQPEKTDQYLRMKPRGRRSFA